MHLNDLIGAIMFMILFIIGACAIVYYDIPLYEDTEKKRIERKNAREYEKLMRQRKRELERNIRNEQRKMNRKSVKRH